jgi:hypothetical protein
MASIHFERVYTLVEQRAPMAAAAEAVKAGLGELDIAAVYRRLGKNAT